jgi:hypothetical protein
MLMGQSSCKYLEVIGFLPENFVQGVRVYSQRKWQPCEKFLSEYWQRVKRHTFSTGLPKPCDHLPEVTDHPLEQSQRVIYILLTHLKEGYPITMQRVKRFATYTSEETNAKKDPIRN